MIFRRILGLFAFFTAGSLAAFTACTDTLESSTIIENGQHDPLIDFRYISSGHPIVQPMGEKTYQIYYSVNRNHPALSYFGNTNIFVTFYASNDYTLLSPSGSCYLQSQGTVYAVWNDANYNFNTTLVVQIYTADGSLSRIQSYPVNRQTYNPTQVKQCPNEPLTLPPEDPGQIDLDIDELNVFQTNDEQYFSFYYRLSTKFSQQTNLRLSLLGNENFVTYMPYYEDGDNLESCEKNYPARDYTNWKYSLIKWTRPVFGPTVVTLNFIVSYGDAFSTSNTIKVNVTRNTYGTINSPNFDALSGSQDPITYYSSE
jgi:hypothetical protein